jgi:hypothetical protein
MALVGGAAVFWTVFKVVCFVLASLFVLALLGGFVFAACISVVPPPR